MQRRVFRSINEPIRDGLSWEQKWKGADGGLIICWEVGRGVAAKDPEVAEKAKNGELPGDLGWKGGVDKKPKNKNAPQKYGSLYYLAQWQGIRGVDLEIYPDEDAPVTCSKTDVTVIFTPHLINREKGE